jgi:uncharacterized protein with HEPN domain
MAQNDRLEYFGIDYTILWKIKQINIPTLSEFMEQLLDNLNNESS